MCKLFSILVSDAQNTSLKHSRDDAEIQLQRFGIYNNQNNGRKKFKKKEIQKKEKKFKCNRIALGFKSNKANNHSA